MEINAYELNKLEKQGRKFKIISGKTLVDKCVEHGRDLEMNTCTHRCENCEYLALEVEELS